MRLRPPPPPKLVPVPLLLLIVAALLSSLARLSDANTEPLPTVGPSPYLIAPFPPTSILSGGDLSSSQPYWRDPNQVGFPFPGGRRNGGGPRQGTSPPVSGDGGPNGGADPSLGSHSSPPSTNGTAPGNGTAPSSSPGNNNSTLTQGAQLILPAAARPLNADPFGAMAFGIAVALLPPVLAAKAAELANAAAAKVFAKKASKSKKKAPSKFCPLSPADRDLLRTVTGAALGAGAGALAGGASAMDLARCAVTLQATKPASFQWVLFSGGQVNPCSIVLGEVSQAIAGAIVEGKCYVPPASTASSAVTVGS